MGDGAEVAEDLGPGAGAGDRPEWSYYDGSGPRGPFTLRAIGQMARAGVVGPDVPVARDGSGGWRPLSEVTGRPPECRAPAVLPEEEAGGTVFRVHLGGLRVPSSRMGFVWGGTLMIEDGGTLLVTGRKLWGGGIRFLGGLLSLIVLVPITIALIEAVTGGVAGLIRGLSPAEPGTLTLILGYLAGVVHGLGAGLMLMAIFAIPLFVAALCMASRGSGRFSIPDGAVVSRKRATVTMPLADGGGRLIRAARITFTSEAEAGRFVGAITGDPGQGQAV